MMPSPKANSLRTQQAIARFGKSARYPVCQAALELWRVKDETRKYAKDAESLEELLVRAKRQKEQARALYKGGKQKEVIQAAALLRAIREHLPKLQASYQANVQLSAIWYEQFYPLAVARFEREGDAVVRTKDTKAFSALKRVKKRWDALAKGASLKDGDYRSLETLKLLRDKTFKATAAKDGAAAYIEAARGGDRPLSDEFWSGRLTVREIHSHLLRIGGPRLAGDKEGKEIRRTMTRLGIRPAEDQRGRKWKMPSPKQQVPKRRIGRQGTKLMFTDNLEVVEAELEKGEKGKTVEYEESLSWKLKNQQELAEARQVSKSIDREIAKLELLRGGRRGRFVY